MRRFFGDRHVDDNGCKWALFLDHTELAPARRRAWQGTSGQCVAALAGRTGRSRRTRRCDSRPCAQPKVEAADPGEKGCGIFTPPSQGQGSEGRGRGVRHDQRQVLEGKTQQFCHNRARKVTEIPRFGVNGSLTKGPHRGPVERRRGHGRPSHRIHRRNARDAGSSVWRACRLGGGAGRPRPPRRDFPLRPHGQRQ